MVKVLERIRAALDHTRRVHDGFDRLTRLQAKYFDRGDLDPGSKAVHAEWIANQLDDIAAHLDASWLATVTTALPLPDEMRADATGWRMQAAVLWVEADWARPGR